MSTTPLTLDDLERWELWGATWRVVQLSDDHAVVDLCQCTGELVERRRCEDPELIAYLRSAQPPATRSDS